MKNAADSTDQHGSATATLLPTAAASDRDRQLPGACSGPLPPEGGHKTTKATTHITRTDGPAWRHYCIIRDNRVTVLDLVPAQLCGWKLRRVDGQGHDDWCGMSADSILAFKAQHIGPLCIVTGEEAARVLETEARGVEVE